jgi:hypothetical protein
MTNIFNILLNTPWWAFAVFALLIVLGLVARKSRTVSIWRLMIAPAVFIGWGAVKFAYQQPASATMLASWALAAAVGIALGFVTSRMRGVTVDRAQGLVSLPGSYAPMVRYLLTFLVLYGLGVATAMLPAMRYELMFWNMAVSALSAGYFFGWAAKLASVYRRSDAEPQAARA